LSAARQGPLPGAVATSEGAPEGAPGVDPADLEARPGTAPGTPGPSDAALADAMARAGRLLAGRPRTEAELSGRLERGGMDAETVAATVERLRALRLVDDAAFARQWIEERARTRGRSGAALLAELEAKGVDRSVAEAALVFTGVDDEAQANLVAEKALPRFARHAPEVQGRRLHQLLLRRGFDPAVAERVARALVPPEGWD
jgi:regulatory protein